MAKKIASLPRNRTQASAYAAIEARKIGMIVAGMVIASELTSGRTVPPFVEQHVVVVGEAQAAGGRRTSHQPVVAASCLERNEFTNRPNVGMVHSTAMQ